MIISAVNEPSEVIHCDTALCFKLNDIHPLCYFEGYLNVNFGVMLS